MRFSGFALCFLFLRTSYSHGGSHGSSDWWTLWNFSPEILLSLIAVFGLYAYGWRSMRARPVRRGRVPGSHGLFFLAAFGTLLLALVSPIDVLSGSLAWVHMLQHTLLMMVAAPAMALSSPAYIGLWSLPPGFWRFLRRARIRFQKWGVIWMARPLSIWWFYGLTLWIWHLPALYESALNDPWVHDLQHLSFFISAYFFWKILLDPFARKPLSPGPGLIYLFVASIHTMFLGVLMALSPVVWYEPYLDTSPDFGLSPLEDQQLAGLIMWMPAGVTYVLAAIVLLQRLFVPRSKNV